MVNEALSFLERTNNKIIEQKHKTYFCWNPSVEVRETQEGQATRNEFRWMRLMFSDRLIYYVVGAATQKKNLLRKRNSIIPASSHYQRKLTSSLTTTRYRLIFDTVYRSSHWFVHVRARHTHAQCDGPLLQMSSEQIIPETRASHSQFILLSSLKNSSFWNSFCWQRQRRRQ